MKQLPEVRYTHLRPEQFDRRIKQRAICYIPLGSLEWHYLHLPLGTDGLEAERMCVDAAQKCGGIVFPPLWLSITGRYRGKDDKFSRNIKVDNQFFEQMLDRIINECREVGFKMILLVCGHGATSVYEKIAHAWYSQKKALVLCAGMCNFSVELGAFADSDHAAFFETSYASFIAPRTVDRNRLKTISGDYTAAGLKKRYRKMIAGENSYYFSDPDFSRRYYILGLDPRLGAGKAIGAQIAKNITTRFTSFVEDAYKQAEENLWPPFDLLLTNKRCWEKCPAFKRDFRQLDNIRRPFCSMCSEASGDIFNVLMKKWGNAEARIFFEKMLKVIQRSPLYFKTRIEILNSILSKLKSMEDKSV